MEDRSPEGPVATLARLPRAPAPFSSALKASLQGVSQLSPADRPELQTRDDRQPWNQVVRCLSMDGSPGRICPALVAVTASSTKWGVRVDRLALLPMPLALSSWGLLPRGPAAPTDPGTLPAPSCFFFCRDLCSTTPPGKRARGRKLDNVLAIPARALVPFRLLRGGRSSIVI